MLDGASSLPHSSDCCVMCTDAGQRRRPGAGSATRRATMAVLAACAAACLCTHSTDAKLTYGAPPRRPSWLPSTSPSKVALNSPGVPRISADAPPSQGLPVGSLWAGCAHAKYARRGRPEFSSVRRTRGRSLHQGLWDAVQAIRWDICPVNLKP